jgi:hypothetical protein
MLRLLPWLLLAAATAALGGPVTALATPAPVPPARAHYLITVADDFVVEVYHNGRRVPDARRHLLLERFGATAERVDLEVRRGDWLVFNVVNNRLRWGGASYFAVAGCFARDEFGFVSRPGPGPWSACDRPGDVDRFLSDRGYLRDRPARAIGRPWGEGDGLMRAFAGAGWKGAPLWGDTPNTWIKVLVD